MGTRDLVKHTFTITKDHPHAYGDKFPMSEGLPIVEDHPHAYGDKLIP